MKCNCKIKFDLSAEGDVGYANHSTLVLFSGEEPVEEESIVVIDDNWDVSGVIDIAAIQEAKSALLTIPSGMWVGRITSLSFDEGDSKFCFEVDACWQGKQAGLLMGASGVVQFHATEIVVTEGTYLLEGEEPLPYERYSKRVQRHRLIYGYDRAIAEAAIAAQQPSSPEREYLENKIKWIESHPDEYYNRYEVIGQASSLIEDLQRQQVPATEAVKENFSEAVLYCLSYGYSVLDGHSADKFYSIAFTKANGATEMREISEDLYDTLRTGQVKNRRRSRAMAIAPEENPIYDGYDGEDD